MLDSVDQVEEDRSRYLYMLFSIHPLPRNQLLAHTLLTRSDDFCFSFLFLPCSNLFPRAGGIVLDQLPGTAGSESEPCSLGPWDAERGAGVGRRRGFALQAVELSWRGGAGAEALLPLYLLSILVTGDGTPWQIPAVITAASEQVPTVSLTR